MAPDISFAYPASSVSIVGEPRPTHSQRMRRALLAIASIDPGADDIDTLMALSEAQQIAEDTLQSIS